MFARFIGDNTVLSDSENCSELPEQAVHTRFVLSHCPYDNGIDSLSAGERPPRLFPEPHVWPT